MALLRSLIGKVRRPAAPAAAAIDAILEEGIARHDSGDISGAAERFDRALAIDPGHARALNLLGVARLAAGEPAAAEALLRRAVAGDAKVAHYHFNLGNAILAREGLAEAAQAFEAALALAPDHFPALFNLGRVRADQGDFDAAIAAGERGVALRPRDAAVLTELGTAHHRKGEATLLRAHFDQAVDWFRRALELPGIPAEAAHNANLLLGDALTKCGRHTEALALFGAARTAAPDQLDANINLANCLNSLGRIGEAASYYERAVALAPRHLPAASSLISALNYDHRLDAAAAAARRDLLVRPFADPARFTSWPNRPDPERRLRIGYVSPDYREHVAMTLFAAVLERHDRRNFEIFAYDATSFRDERNRTLRAHADHWREIDRLDTAAATAMIRADGIDVLVDLAGHTAGNRLMVFARKPAPVQATWLAYPGSTGLPEIDYLVSDAHTSPPDFDSLVTESVWRLPHTRFCFTPPAASPAPRLPAPALPVTFGCFNNPSKFNPPLLALWQRILAALPRSRLLLKYPSLDDATARERLSADLVAAGIDLSRVDLRGWSNYVDTLAAYGDVHVALDPFPYCGGLTSLDALWMGVPVVTLEASPIAGRQTIAMLSNIGRADLIARDPDDYVRLALEWAGDPDRLAHCRPALRDAMWASPLMDPQALARDIGEAWRGMWRAWCLRQGKP